MLGLVLPVPQSEGTVMNCLQGPGAQHAAWFRELRCEAMLMAVHDNLYKMEEYAVHSSAEAYVGTFGKQCLPTCMSWKTDVKQQTNKTSLHSVGASAR